MIGAGGGLIREKGVDDFMIEKYKESWMKS